MRWSRSYVFGDGFSGHCLLGTTSLLLVAQNVTRGKYRTTLLEKKIACCLRLSNDCDASIDAIGYKVALDRATCCTRSANDRTGGNWISSRQLGICTSSSRKGCRC